MGLHLSASATNQFVQKWQPNTPYLAGDIRMAPDGTIVSRISDGTSGSSYTGANWTVVAGGTSLSSYVSQVATLSDYPVLFPSVTEIATVVYNSGTGVGVTRPSATKVFWEGFPTQPTNMADGDEWHSDLGGTILNGTGAPTSGDGANGDFWFRTSNSTIYGPKASGSWPAGVSLVGTAGTNGRGITTIARTSGTGAAGTTDTYTITYSDASTSTFNVVNGADGAGASLTVQDEGGSLATAATTMNFVGAGVTASGTGAAKTITIPGATSNTLTPTAKTTTYTAAANDLVIADASGGAFTVTLPTPTAGVRIGVKKNDSSANAVTIATTSGTIDGASTRTLPVQFAAQVFVADGTNWFRLDVPSVNAVAATGTASSTTFLRGDGAWSTPATGGAVADYKLPTGALAATHDRGAVTMGSLTPTSQVLYLSGVSLTAGLTLSTVSVRSGSSGWATVTHSWVVLCDANRVVLAVSADDTTATLAGNVTKTFTLGSAYTVPTSGLYYAGLMIAAGTLTFTGPASFGTQQVTIPPILAGTSSTAQTTPPSVGATMTTISPVGIHPYLWLS